MGSQKPIFYLSAAAHDNMAAHEKLHPGSEAEVPASSTSISARDSTRPTVSKYLKDKEREWNKVAERKGPLTLLELPVDILRLIIKEASRLHPMML
jgi:hypothetical protein